MNIQRLRNLTTGILHTDINHVYEDLEYLSGESGLMTHLLPAARQAALPYLRSKINDVRFWNAKYDPEHTGEFDIPPMDPEAKENMWALYSQAFKV